MSILSVLNVAIVHEWLVSYAGSEKVVEQVKRIFPQADIFCLVDFLDEDTHEIMGLGQTTTSFLQRIPGSRRNFRAWLPLMPLAVEQFDLSAYDLIISSSHAVAKGVLTRPDQLHISYVHTPIRYGWELQHQYLQQAGLTHGIKGALTRCILHYLRLWDVASAQRVDVFVANSRFIAGRIHKTYRRPAEVIYPPVAIQRFHPAPNREDFYLTVCRFVPYKRLDLILQAFSRLGLPLVVIGDGELRSHLQASAPANIQFLGYQSDEVVADHLERCKAFVYAAEEDFGITLVEAQAAGAPVITYGRGGAVESVIEGKTGILFAEQSVDCLVEAVRRYESQTDQFDPEIISKHAEKYSTGRFRDEFQGFTSKTWEKFRRGDALE